MSASPVPPVASRTAHEPDTCAVAARARARGHLFSLLLPLAAALVVRILVWWMLPYQGQISDEAEYLGAATWLAQGRGFSFYKEWIWTRPPIYLLFLAAHIRIFGPANLVPIRISQTILSVATVALTMLWGARLAAAGRARRVALIAGWAMAVCYSLATYAFLLLSETLFLFWLMLGLVLLTIWAQAARPTGKASIWLIAGGAALGLGALTRGLLVGCMPGLAAWVWWQSARDGTASLTTNLRRLRAWRPLGQVLLFTAAVSAVILPWSVWNSRFYGNQGLILIDTTGGYNALLGAQAAHQEIDPSPLCARTAARCEEQIYETLKPIASQAQRQAVANRLAWQWILANPGGFVRKTLHELVDLLTINYGGAERLRSGHTEGQIPIPHLLGLLLDDTLYLLAAPLALAGLVWRQARPGKGLAAIWIGYNLVTGPLFFAINRFRVPLLPMLFVYAACALADRRTTSRPRHWIGSAAAAALLVLLLPSFAYWGTLQNGFPATNGDSLSILHNTFLGVRARVVAWDCDHADAALARGDVDAAQRYVDRGAAQHVRGAYGLSCFALLQARIDERRGQYQEALALLQSMARTPERFLLEADIFLHLGQRQKAFGAVFAPELENANPTAWAWGNLAPLPATRIDLGSGFDWGYIDGFWGREGRAEDPDNYRWTGPRSRLRFPGAGTGMPQTLRLRVNGGRREAVDPPARLTVLSADCPAGACAFDLGPSWQTIEAPLPATTKGKDVIVELRSTVMVSSPAELARRQQVRAQLRLLGAQVDWAELR